MSDMGPFLEEDVLSEFQGFQEEDHMSISKAKVIPINASTIEKTMPTNHENQASSPQQILHVLRPLEMSSIKPEGILLNFEDENSIDSMVNQLQMKEISDVRLSSLIGSGLEQERMQRGEVGRLDRFQSPQQNARRSSENSRGIITPSAMRDSQASILLTPLNSQRSLSVLNQAFITYSQSDQGQEDSMDASNARPHDFNLAEALRAEQAVLEQNDTAATVNMSHLRNTTNSQMTANNVAVFGPPSSEHREEATDSA